MKTHQELGITAEEREALIATIGVLEQEQFQFDMSRACSVHKNNDRLDWVRDAEGLTFLSGESTARTTSMCDTACCIGGTMSLLMQSGMRLPAVVTAEMGTEAARYVNSKELAGEPLFRLFWDATDDEVEPAEGIEAIRRFLDGNTADPWLVRS